ncbi:reverse transcriptase domain-containing protein [Tanacetum coccineum]
MVSIGGVASMIRVRSAGFYVRTTCQRNLDIFGMGPITHEWVSHERSQKQVENPTRILPSKAEKTPGQATERAKAHSGRRLLPTTRDRLESGKQVHSTNSPYADTLSSASWTHTRGITKSKWPRMTRKKTAFHTSQGVYCYTQDAFGLKNAGATTMTGLDNVFEGQVAATWESMSMTSLLYRATPRTRQGHFPLVKTLKTVYEEGRTSVGLQKQRSFPAVQASNMQHFHASRTRPEGELDNILYPRTMGYLKLMRRGDCKVERVDREHNISYRPRTAVKGQILADFLIEKPETNVVLPPSEKICGDSRLVANHVLGEYVAKEDNMIQYLDKTKSLIQSFDRFTIRQVPRGDNKKADALSKIASTSFAHLSKQGTLPHEQKDARRIRRTAQRFELRDGVLYRRSFLQPWLRCVGPIQADYVLREIHAGSCSMHSGPRSVVARALRSGYYWPTMHRDARDMIKKCKDCQVHRPIPRQPTGANTHHLTMAIPQVGHFFRFDTWKAQLSPFVETYPHVWVTLSAISSSLYFVAYPNDLLSRFMRLERCDLVAGTVTAVVESPTKRRLVCQLLLRSSS